MNDLRSPDSFLANDTINQEEPGYLRQSGLDSVGALPWGTHFCQFYATGEDLLDTLVPYFREGLAANEFCMWVTSEPLQVAQAREALGMRVPDLDERIARGQIEILDYRQWYTATGTFDAEAVLQGWLGKLANARRRGFEGLRLTGNTFWLEEAIWENFKHYENTVHNVLGNMPVLALCTYSLEKCGLREILDVLANHEFALIKQGAEWEIIRSVARQAELALRESRERLARFAEITFEGIAISENGKIVDCNEQFARLTGYPVQELKGMAVLELVAPADREQVLENIRLGCDVHYLEHALLRKDGTLITVEAHSKTSPSNPAQRFTAVRDITDHKQAAEKLLATQRDLKRAQAVGHIGSWRLDIRRNELLWSDENHRIFGIAKGTPLTYEIFLAVVHPEDREYVNRMWQAALQGAPYDIEHRLVVDGEVKWVRERAELEFDRVGNLLGGFGTTQEISELKRVEHELRRSEALLRTITDNTPDPIYIKDRDSRILLINPAALRVTGKSEEKVLGKTPVEIFDDPAVGRMMMENDRCVMESGDTKENEVVVRSAEGERILLSIKTPYRDVHGDIVGIIGISHDITKRKEAEEALRASSERYQSLFSSMSEGFILSELLCDEMGQPRDYRFLKVNPAFERLTGLKRDEVVGKTHYHVFPGSDPVWVSRFGEAALTGRPVKFDKYSTALNRHFELFAYRTKERQFAVIFSDITERKQAENKLRESEELNRRIIASSADCIKVLDLAGNLLSMSEGGQRLLEIADVRCYINGSWIGFWREEDQPSVRNAIALAQSGELGQFQAYCPSEKGMPKWWDVAITPILGGDGKVERLLAVSRDVTERKQAELVLRDAARRKDEFLAMLAHELRNPLAPIRNAAHVLGQLDLAEPRVKWARETIEGQVAHLSFLVDDLLDISRIVRGKVVLKKKNVEFSTLAKQALEAARPLIENKRHQLAVRLPDAPVWLEVDPVRLTQVLVNLLDNAAKYNTDGGKIEFEARLDGQEIEIKVLDNGMGIPAELLPHIFELFQQGERNLDRSLGGLGIGLTLVQQLVEMHGGSVAAYSDGPSRGATFIIRLPTAAPPHALPPAPKQGNQRPVQAIRVLVVDDDAAVADSTAMLLEIEGHEVRVAHDGHTALEMVRGFRPQAVLLDIGLVGMDGFETAKQLRRLPEGRELFLMAVTGYGDEETKVAALEAGCNRHLIKPLSINLLLDLLVEEVSGRHAG
ncbi:MAG: PAS domain S-box protein [Sulfuricella sp.]|nr:PAS domain S-box protein [Sulfuricella sp.]